MKNNKNRTIKTSIFLALVGILLVFCCANVLAEEYYYVIGININGSNLILDNASLNDEDFSFIFANHTIGMNSIGVFNSKDAESYYTNYYTYSIKNSTKFTAKIVASDGSVLSGYDFDSRLRFYYWELAAINFTTEEQVRDFGWISIPILVLPYSDQATRLVIIQNGTELYSYNLPVHPICNSNSVCENQYNDHAGMFENYLSCPADCDYFAHDGVCNIALGQEYAFNDGYCDEDCWQDMENEDPYTGGECIKESCEGQCDGECFPCDAMECHAIENGVSWWTMDSINYCIDENTAIQFYCGWNLWDVRTWFNSVTIEDEVTCNTREICQNGACIILPTCSDNIKNQNEEEIDCGGLCPACSISREVPPAPPAPGEK